MAKLPLTVGDYQARNVIAEAQRCVNLYAEKNPPDAEQPFTYYPTPGTSVYATGTTDTGVPLSGWRCLYVASNQVLYGVSGSAVYRIDANATLTLLGFVNTTGSVCSMADNGTTMVIVDGSAEGYQVTLSTGAFSVISDVNFLGGTRIQYIDTFFVSNVPGTREFQSSLSNSATWDALFFASKSGYADNLATLVVVHREIWLIGEKTTEVWFNAGGATFPFSILPGVFIEQGTSSPWSVAQYDLLVFWLGENFAGSRVVFMGKNYSAVRISTHAIENAMTGYADVRDAIGIISLQEGHVFYILSFPTANKTWVYDLASGLWHERVWLNPADGTENMWRPSCVIQAYGAAREFAGDFENGSLYLLSLDLYEDIDANGHATPIPRIKGYPHIVDDGKRVHYPYFSADVGIGPLDPSTTATLSLSWSDNRGATFGNEIDVVVAQGNEFLAQPKWNRLGMARDRVFKLRWSFPYKAALSGAYIETVPMGS